MTPDERDRTMEFILRQQAQFEINLQRQQEQLQQQQHQSIRISDAVLKLTELAELQSNRMDRYEEWQQRSMIRNDQRFDGIIQRLDAILSRVT
jgi:hypothetical protein